jgi:hypothetical protein
MVAAAVVNFTNFVVHAGVKQNASAVVLPSINVGRNTDIAVVFSMG